MEYRLKTTPWIDRLHRQLEPMRLRIQRIKTTYDDWFVRQQRNLNAPIPTAVPEEVSTAIAFQENAMTRRRVAFLKEHDAEIKAEASALVERLDRAFAEVIEANGALREWENDYRRLLWECGVFPPPSLVVPDLTPPALSGWRARVATVLHPQIRATR